MGLSARSRSPKGNDGVKLWDSAAGIELPAPQQDLTVRGPTSCMLWFARRDDPYETLCYGTALGFIIFWRKGSREVSLIYRRGWRD